MIGPAIGDHSTPEVEVLSAVPSSERLRILSGMRWSVWLSLLAVPFSFGTTVLLAHLGPEVIGTYGLLLVYISAGSSLLYFGGDSVTVHFVPLMDREKRASFLLTYFLIILATLIPWIAAATLLPEGLRFLLGTQDGHGFQLLMVYLAPLCIARMMVLAALTAVLEIRWSQLLNRAMTVGTFMIYAAILVFSAPFFRKHHTGLIWGLYMGMSGLTLVLGILRLTRIDEWQHGIRALRLSLPAGFWRYTLAIEQVSAVGFFQNRLDMLLILNVGGLETFGEYVALLTFAMVPPMINRWFLDALLPALSTLLARREITAASQVFATNLRILFALQLTVACIGCALVNPLMHLLGTTYVREKSVFTVMFLFSSMASVGGAGGTLLTSVGKQQRAVWVGLLQLVLLLSMFLALWPRLHLLGAVLASGGAALIAQTVLLAVARRSGPLVFHFWQDYFCFVLSGSGMAAATMLTQAAVPTSLCLAGVAIFLYVVSARYTTAELRRLLHCLIPEGARVPVPAGTSANA